MPASYPDSVKVFTTKTTGQVIQASHINEPQDEITAIEQGLLQGLAHALFPNIDTGQDLGTTIRRWRQLLVQKIAAGTTNTTRLRIQEVGTSTWITVNADFDGTNWNREDTTQPAQGIEINNNKEVKYYRAAAGTNPITWTDVFTISTDKIIASQAVIGTDPGGTEVLRAQNLRAGPTTITGALSTTDTISAPTAVIGTDPGGTEVLRAQNLRAGATTLTEALTAPSAVIGTDPGGTESLRAGSARLNAPVLLGSVPQFTMAEDPTSDMQVATKRYVDNNAPSTEPWRILGVIRPSTNVTSVNFTGLNISPPAIMRLVAVIRSSAPSSVRNVSLRVNNEDNSFAWTTINVYPSSSSGYMSFNRYSGSSYIAYLYASNYVTVITCTIAFDPSGFVAATSHAGHQTLSGPAGTPDVEIFHTIREGGAVTSLNSIELVTTSNSIGANSVFYLEYLAP
jgi:hypothetical protein